MMIKGILLALAIAGGAYAEERELANPSSGNRRRYGGGGGSNWRRKRPAGSVNRRYGGGGRPRKPMAPGMRRRRRWSRPNNWVRPNSRPSNWVKPVESESESWDGGDSWDSLDSYDQCDSKLKATCCGLYGVPEEDRRDVCYAVGCNYDDCDWSDDGWKGDTAEPTSEPTWAADGWQKDGWNDSCLAVDQKMCCSLPSSISTYKKISLCDKVGCDYNKCDWNGDAWKASTPEPTSPEPTVYPTAAPTFGKSCNAQSRDMCCNQSYDVSVTDRKKVCAKLGCMYQKCGWKRDGYDDDEDDDYKITWKNDGYKDDYDDKDYGDDDKSGYNKKDGYGPSYYNTGDYKDSYKGSDDNYRTDDYRDDKYDPHEDGYDKYWNEYKNKNYGDDDEDDDITDLVSDKCTSEERDLCCRANDKDQWDVCKILGCNIKKCDKKDWDDDGYKTSSGNKKNNPTLRPTWRNQPYYMDKIDSYNGDRPTPRPSYRKYGTPTGNYYPADGYRNTNDYPSNPTGYDVYTPTQPYNPYAPTPGWYSPYNPNPTTPTGWTGDQWSSPTGWTGDQWSKPSGSEWSSGVWKGTDTKNWWSSTKKYKTARPSASPSISSAPSLSSEPSSSPSESSAPSISSAPTKAPKTKRPTAPKPYQIKEVKVDNSKYEKEMKSMQSDLADLKALLQMSLEQDVAEDEVVEDAVTESAVAETDKLKAEIEELKAIIAVEAAAEGMDENVENELEVTLIEVENEVKEVEKVLEEKKAAKKEKGGGGEKKKKEED